MAIGSSSIPGAVSQLARPRTTTDPPSLSVERDSRSAVRSRLLIPSSGFVETVARTTPNANTVLTSGQMLCSAIPLLKGDVVNGFIGFAGAAGVLPLNSWAALLGPIVPVTAGAITLGSDTAPKLAVSNDLTTTNFAAGDRITYTLATPYVVPEDGLYNVGIVSVATTTPINLRGATGISNIISGTTLGDPLGWIGNTGLTTPASCPTNVTVTLTSSNRPYLLAF